MAWNNMRITCLQALFIFGCFTWNNNTFAAEAEETKKKKAGKSSVLVRNNMARNDVPFDPRDDESKIRARNGAPFSAQETAGSTRFDFDNLTRLMEEDKTPLSTMTPDWLNLAVEHRTRYDVYDHGFTRNIPGFNDQVHQRTRFLMEIKNIIDPLRFTLELTDIRAPLAHYGQAHSPVFANHFDFTQLHADLVTNNLLGSGYAAKFEVGRFLLETGEARLLGGHRWGTFTPTFDGMKFTMGNDKEKWGLLIFGTRPVNRQPTTLDWNTPATYFSGIQITNRDLPWANVDAYFLQLNEGNKLRQRNLSTTGFRVFARPTKDRLDYEIESMYQFGDTQNESLFAHRHHGEVGYSFDTKISDRNMPTRLVYLFDFSSGSSNPNKNFDILYAKRRVEYGPTGMFGPFFPSNLFSPVGFRATLIPTPQVRLMMSHRAYWLADKHGAYVGSGLQDRSGQAGSFLGNMLDISVGWDPQWSYLKRVSFDIGYSHIFKGDYFDKVAQGLSADTNYGYTMATFKF